jgi:hypothetical protein
LAFSQDSGDSRRNSRRVPVVAPDVAPGRHPRGRHAGDPDRPGPAGAAAAGTAGTAPSITTTVADTRLIHLAAFNAEGTVTAPAGMTERWVAAAPTGDSRDALSSSSDATQPAAGATGPRTATATEPGARIGVLLALRPAPVTSRE